MCIPTQVDNPESHDGDSTPRSEASACHNHPEQIPTAGTSSGEENDIENHGRFLLQDPSAERLIDGSRGEHQALSREASETGESDSEGRSNNRHCGPDAAARDALLESRTRRCADGRVGLHKPCSHPEVPLNSKFICPYGCSHSCQGDRAVEFPVWRRRWSTADRS